MPKFHIHEFYGFTKTYAVEADDYDEAWEEFWMERATVVYDGSDDPQLESQECEEQPDA